MKAHVTLMFTPGHLASPREASQARYGELHLGDVAGMSVGCAHPVPGEQLGLLAAAVHESHEAGCIVRDLHLPGPLCRALGLGFRWGGAQHPDLEAVRADDHHEMLQV